MTRAWADLMQGLRFAWSRVAGERSTVGILISTAMLFAGLLALTILGALAAAAPQLVLVLIGALALLVGLAALFYTLAPGGPIWVRACLMVVMAHLLFSYGFGNATVGVGGARVPISEVILLVSLGGSAAYFWRVGFGRLPMALWFFLVWLVFLLAIHLPVGFARYGSPALRDALPTVQALFVIPGYCVGHLALSDPAKRNWAVRCLLGLGVALALYGLLYPLQTTLLALSPRVTGLQQSVPLVGYYTTWPTVAVTGLFGVLLWRWAMPQPARRTLVTAAALLLLTGFGLGFLLMQSRGGYVMFVVVTVMMLALRGQRGTVLRVAVLLLTGLLLLAVVGASGLEIKGRIGQLSLDTISAHLLTLSGEAESGSGLEGAAAGIEQRSRWGTQSLKMWSADIQSMVVGVGYGPALTDFVVGGAGGRPIVVREPHNSYVTTLTRMGAVGFLVMMTIHTVTLLAALRLYRWHLHRGERSLAGFTLGCAVFFVCNYVNAIGQPNFESPHFVVPYFFLAGVIAAMDRMRTNDHR